MSHGYGFPPSIQSLQQGLQNLTNQVINNNLLDIDQLQNLAQQALNLEHQFSLVPGITQNVLDRHRASIAQLEVFIENEIRKQQIPIDIENFVNGFNHLYDQYNQLPETPENHQALIEQAQNLQQQRQTITQNIQRTQGLPNADQLRIYVNQIGTSIANFLALLQQQPPSN
uniref:Uncharacterized protein n=1 Tax=Meloidogyne enterolobii TaxID=390850 RepID=A0A6V7W8M0_MELEN|nr:unnamed protein product [Meloidogyne enterolobii]